MTSFFRLIGTAVADKAAELRRAVRLDQGELRFEWSPSDFSKVPGSPFAYWVSSGIRETFQRLSPFQGRGMSGDCFPVVKERWFRQIPLKHG